MTSKACCVNIKHYYEERLNLLNWFLTGDDKDRWEEWREETRQGADGVINNGMYLTYTKKCVFEGIKAIASFCSTEIF